MRTQDELLADLIDRLLRAPVEFMLTGSMASNYWGIPRTTHDIDIVVLLIPAQVNDLVSVFSPGMFVQESAVRGAFHPPYQFNVIDEQSSLKIDFWLLRDKPLEQSMFLRKRKVVIRGRPVHIASAEDVILHKLYWDSLTPSERQLADVAGVCAVQEGFLDLPYIEGWVDRLGVRQVWDAVRSGQFGPKFT